MLFEWIPKSLDCANCKTQGILYQIKGTAMDININMSRKMGQWIVENQANLKKYIDTLEDPEEGSIMFISELCRAYNLADALIPGKGLVFLTKLTEIAETNDQIKIREMAQSIIKGAILPVECKEREILTRTHCEPKSNGGGCLPIVIVLIAISGVLGVLI